MSEANPAIETEAEYALEFAVKCPGCSDWIERVGVVRMLRTKINFTSTLPRRGRVVVCTKCSTMLSAEIGMLS